MTTTVKTVLIGGVVLAGGYLAFKALRKPASAPGAAKTASPPGLITQLVAAGSSIIQNLGRGGQSSAAPVPPSNPFTTVTTRDSAAQADYATSHGVTDLEGNELIDLNTGNALVYGPDAPAPYAPLD